MSDLSLLRLVRAAILLVPITVFCKPTLVEADNWPAWRGPEGTGVTREKNLPLHWNTNEHVRWRVPLPDRGNSTPIVWGDRVFVTQAITNENRRTLMCFARADGKLLWQSGVTWTNLEPTYPDNPYCSPSPVTDGERIYAWFGSAGVYCYDFRGKEVWHRDLGPQNHVWGHASAPILYRDLCILNFGPGEQSFLIAMDRKTGRTAWQFDPPSIPPTAKWEEFGGESKFGDRPGTPKISEIAGSWATPIVVRADGREELVVPLAMRLLALSPGSGKQLWSCDGPNIGAYSSAFLGDGIVGLTASGLRNTALAVRPGGTGDVTATHRLWLQHPGNSQACIGSGVIYRDHMYLMTAMGMAQCLELKTGKMLWEERLTGSGARNASWSSPVLAGDRLYVPNQNADVFVLRAGSKFELLAMNTIGGEPMNASLAVSDGDIFIRTDRNLWCIGEAPR